MTSDLQGIKFSCVGCWQEIEGVSTDGSLTRVGSHAPDCPIASPADNRIAELEHVIELVRQARVEGWYDEDPRWAPIDRIIGVKR